MRKNAKKSAVTEDRKSGVEQKKKAGVIDICKPHTQGEPST